MTTTGTVLLVGGVGVAVFLYMRSQQQQTAAVVAAAVAPGMGAGGVAGAPAASGGGVGNLAGRLYAQWKQDPLGIANAKSVIGTGVGVAKTAVSQVAHLGTDIVGGIKSIF